MYRPAQTTCKNTKWKFQWAKLGNYRWTLKGWWRLRSNHLNTFRPFFLGIMFQWKQENIFPPWLSAFGRSVYKHYESLVTRAEFSLVVFVFRCWRLLSLSSINGLCRLVLDGPSNRLKDCRSTRKNARHGSISCRSCSGWSGPLGFQRYDIVWWLLYIYIYIWFILYILKYCEIYMHIKNVHHFIHTCGIWCYDTQHRGGDREREREGGTIMKTWNLWYIHRYASINYFWQSLQGHNLVILVNFAT